MRVIIFSIPDAKPLLPTTVPSRVSFVVLRSGFSGGMFPIFSDTGYGRIESYNIAFYTICQLTHITYNDILEVPGQTEILEAARTQNRGH